MIGDQERSFLIGMPGAAEFAHGAAEAEQTFNGRRAQGDEDPRLNDLNLLGKIRQAGLHFLRSRGAIAAGRAGCVRPAFQNVGDVDVTALEAHGLDDFGEQLAGFTDEGFGLLVFIGAWTLLRGILEIAAAIQMRHETEDAWLLALDGVISVIFGLSVLAYPGAGALALIWIIAAYAIASGIVLIMLSFRARQHRRARGGEISAAPGKPA